MSIQRTVRFVRDPVVPFQRVADENGHTFNTFAAMLGVRDGSLLAADIGGALYYSRLRIFDLGGLIDKTIARTLPDRPFTSSPSGRQDEFHEYVFGTIKPTFIRTHSYWAQAANLDADSRFRRDYVPIVESVDKWLKTWRDREILSGAYVRKDAVAGREDILARMRALGIQALDIRAGTGRMPAPANP